MSLEAEVRDAFEAAGRELKADLWQASDAELLKQRARDLVGLHVKAAATTEASKKAQYRLAAELVLDHVQLLALTRMHVAEQHLREALKRLFTKTVMPALLRLLPALL